MPTYIHRKNYTHYTFHNKERLKERLDANSQERTSLTNVLDTLVDENYLKKFLLQEQIFMY